MSETVIYAMSIVMLIGAAGLGLWFLRESLGLGGVPLFASRQRRLGVVESTSIDGKRRLLLVRRDNVEHLIMTGGPVDVLVETGIPTTPRTTLIGIEPLPVSPPTMTTTVTTQGLNGREPAIVPVPDKIPVSASTETN
jgi:flagellar protein FliO/FliZ